MSENNIPNQEELEKMARELQMLNEQRAGSIKSLKERLAKLLANDKLNVSNMSAVSVELHRDAGFALNSACQALEAHDRLVDMLVHDLTQVIQTQDRIAGHALQTSAYVQTILAILKKKGLTDDNELQAVWDNLSKGPPVSQE